MAVRLDSLYVTVTSPYVIMTTMMSHRLCLSPVIDSYLFHLAGLRYAHMLPGLLVSPVLVTPNLLSDFLPLPDWTLFVSLTFMALTPVCTCSSLTRI